MVTSLPSLVASLILVTMKIEQVNPNFICKFWPRISHLIERGLKYSAGEYTAEQLKVMLIMGNQSLLIALDDAGEIHGVATVATESYPNAQVAFITCIAGHLISSHDLFDQLKAWARNRGFTVIRGAARESIARLWKQKFNFEQRYIIVEQAV